jgi:phosphoglycolate phosphatase-like HAD superfamily hydrolase
VREFLIENCRKKSFVLVTATPQKEMVEILSFLNIKECFREVHGAPSKKEDIIRSFLNKQKIMRNKALMIGDSETDFLAAKSNMIPFMLCRSGVNCAFQESYKGISFSSLIKG